MKFTRDGAIWMVLFIGGLAAFLGGHYGLFTRAFPSVSQVWEARFELIAALAGFVGAYFRMSPRPLSPDNQMATFDASQKLTLTGQPKFGAFLLACVLAAASVSACGPKQYHTAVVANTSIAQAIFAVQDAEIAAHNAKLVTDAKHVEYKAQILTLLQAGDDLTLALKDWDPAKPVPANVVLAIGHVQALLTDLRLNSPQATALLMTVQTVLSVLRGSGVLPADAAIFSLEVVCG